jgi:hypothetical protein
MGSAGGKIGTEAIAADILHSLFVGNRGHGAGNEILAERFVQENEIRKATADGRHWFLE